MMRRLPYRSPRRPLIGGGDGGGQQGCGDDPGRVRARRIEQLGQLADQRHDERLHDRGNHAGEGEHGDHGIGPNRRPWVVRDRRRGAIRLRGGGRISHETVGERHRGLIRISPCRRVCCEPLVSTRPDTQGLNQPTTVRWIEDKARWDLLDRSEIPRDRRSGEALPVGRADTCKSSTLDVQLEVGCGAAGGGLSSVSHKHGNYQGDDSAPCTDKEDCGERGVVV